MMGTGGMGLFWIWPLLVVVGLVLLGFLGYQRVQGRSDGSPRDEAHSDAQRILDERFARGEIDEEEYRLRRSMLR